MLSDVSRKSIYIKSILICERSVVVRKLKSRLQPNVFLNVNKECGLLSISVWLPGNQRHGNGKYGHALSAQNVILDGVLFAFHAPVVQADQDGQAEHDRERSVFRHPIQFLCHGYVAAAVQILRLLQVNVNYPSSSLSKIFQKIKMEILDRHLNKYHGQAILLCSRYETIIQVCS